MKTTSSQQSKASLSRQSENDTLDKQELRTGLLSNLMFAIRPPLRPNGGHQVLASTAASGDVWVSR